VGKLEEAERPLARTQNPVAARSRRPEPQARTGRLLGDHFGTTACRVDAAVRAVLPADSQNAALDDFEAIFVSELLGRFLPALKHLESHAGSSLSFCISGFR
jgi:hypothetical protein